MSENEQFFRVGSDYPVLQLNRKIEIKRTAIFICNHLDIVTPMSLMGSKRFDRQQKTRLYRVTTRGQYSDIKLFSLKRFNDAFY